jgi:hypothetical protein
MALQDLTPQLRTRLSRMERAVGWFVMLATALLLFGFGFYIYKTAERKGWFLKKITYQTCVASGAGLKIGDPVKLMGFDIGEIKAIVPNDPYAYYNITVVFEVKINQYHYEGYIWTDSKVKVNASDLLGNRYLEITKGIEGVPTVLLSTNNQFLGVLRGDRFKARFEELEKDGKSPSAALADLNREVRSNPITYFTNQLSAGYVLDPLESMALTERLDKVISQVESALPNILNLTNQLAATLVSATTLTSNLNTVAVNAQPVVGNLTTLTSQLNQPGALGNWLLPTNVNAKLDSVMGNADTAVGNLNTNLVTLNLSLLHLSDLTSNLNQQVQVNTNILSNVSKAVTDLDDLVQGLKHHWLLRSAFKKENTNAAPKKSTTPALSPKQQGTR